MKNMEELRRALAARMVAASPSARQAITTVFLGPTDHRDPRIKATAYAGSITVVWDDALGIEQNHAVAAAMLAVHLTWAQVDTFADVFSMGSLKGGGYVFVDNRDSNRQRMTFEYHGRTDTVASVADAVRIWNAYVASTGCGVSEIGNGGTVRRAGEIVATISYNGRVWNPDGKAVSP